MRLIHARKGFRFDSENSDRLASQRQLLLRRQGNLSIDLALSSERPIAAELHAEASNVRIAILVE